MSLSLIVLIVCPAMCVIMFLYLKWYIKNRTSSSGVLKETRIEVQNWIKEVNLSVAEINSVTDRNLQLIENKIEKLNRLLEDTDRRISDYANDVEKSKSRELSFTREQSFAREALYTQLGRGVRAAVKTDFSSPDKAVKLSVIRPDFPLEPAVKPASAGPSAKETQPHSPGTPVEPGARSLQDASPKQIRQQIESLAEEGLSAEKIASRLGISIGEAELALQLRRG